MAYEYDRFEREEGGGSFLMGLLAGTVLGAGLGMLFAPKAGSELRNQLSEQAGNIANQASEGYRRASESAEQWADKGREVYNKASEAVAKGAEEAQKYIKTARESSGSSDFGGSSSSSGSTFGSGSTYGGSSDSSTRTGGSRS